MKEGLRATMDRSDKKEQKPEGDKPAASPLSAEILAKLPQQDSLKTTLYDLADSSISRRAKLTGESQDPKAVYGELNRIMGLNGYPSANIDGKVKVTDKDLPKAWNSVKHDQVFNLYDKPDTTTENLRKRLLQDIIGETSTVPVQEGEGYFQVLKRMHPEVKDDDINKEAHRIKHINKDRDVLKVGERLPTATEEERQRELEKRFKAATEPKPEPKPQPAPAPKPEPLPEPKPEPKPEPAPPPKPEPLPEPKPEPKPEPAPPPKPEPLPEPTPDKPNPGVKPGPDGKPNPQPDAEAQARAQKEQLKQSMTGAYSLLEKQLSHAEDNFHKGRDGQGIIGRAFDGAKNTIGTSGEGLPWYNPSRLWSGVFDSDLGSKAIDQKVAQQKQDLGELKKALDSGDEARFKSIYKNLTGKDFQPGQNDAALSVKQTVKSFDESQRAGVDTITDIGAGAAAALSLRYGASRISSSLLRVGTLAPLLGATTKATMMQVDGHYANLPRDLAMGGVVGLTVPLGEMAGSQVSRLAGKKLGLTVTGDLFTSRIETQGASIGTKFLSAALKSGTSGSVFGGIQAPASEVARDMQEGKEIHAGDLSLLAVKGAALGFIGGTALGAASDRLADGFKRWKPEPFDASKPKINGVEIGDRATVGMDDAAKLLKMKPDALAAKAAADPYAAVHDAVRLYEKTGVNISKEAAGQKLPGQFVDALKTVQDVDLLTGDQSVKLAQKVNIVKSTDAYLKANPTAIDEPLQRLSNDARYQELMQLKAQEQGPAAAAQFDETFRSKFASDLKVASAVERVKDGSLSDAQAVAKAAPETEAAYKQKTEAFFKDMTDPAQRQRLVDLVEDIHGKFNPELISKTDLTEILDRVPQQNRDLAVALLNESAGLSSDSVLKANLQALRSDIQAATGSAAPDNVYTLGANTSGNLLGYLYRKSNSMSMSIRNIDTIADKTHVPNSIVLFDDLSSTQLTLGQQKLLAQVPHVYAVDVGAFEKGINVVDLSKGPAAVSQKLDQLLAEAEKVRAANPGLLPTGVAREVLSGAVDRSAAAIGPNVQVIRPSGAIKVPHAVPEAELSAMSDVDAIHARINVPKASREEIAGFLSGYAGQDRELAAQMLADGAVHNSFPVMVAKAVDLHKKLTDALAGAGMTMKDLVLVTDKDPGGSTHLISYLFGRANGLGQENYVSTRGLDKMLKSGVAKDRALAYFDDTIYSGSQTTNMLDNNISSLMPFKRIVVASLGAYEKGMQSIRGTHLSSIGKVEVATAATHQPFYSSKNPFFAGLNSSQQTAVKGIGGSEGFGSVQGSIIWSYMYPDNNLSFFGNQFSGKVLRLPGP